jgi:hypothetical protein
MEVRGDQAEALVGALAVPAVVVALGDRDPAAMADDLVGPQDPAANRLIWKT